MIVFGILPAAVIATYVVIFIDGRTNWEHASGQALDVLKSVVLTVVTLVLGFYLGQSSKSQ